MTGIQINSLRPRAESNRTAHRRKRPHCARRARRSARAGCRTLRGPQRDVGRHPDVSLRPAKRATSCAGRNETLGDIPTFVGRRGVRIGEALDRPSRFRCTGDGEVRPGPARPRQEADTQRDRDQRLRDANGGSRDRAILEAPLALADVLERTHEQCARPLRPVAVGRRLQRAFVMPTHVREEAVGVVQRREGHEALGRHRPVPAQLACFLQEVLGGRHPHRDQHVFDEDLALGDHLRIACDDDEVDVGSVIDRRRAPRHRALERDRSYIAAPALEEAVGDPSREREPVVVERHRTPPRFSSSARR